MSGPAATDGREGQRSVALATKLGFQGPTNNFGDGRAATPSLALKLGSQLVRHADGDATHPSCIPYASLLCKSPLRAVVRRLDIHSLKARAVDMRAAGAVRMSLDAADLVRMKCGREASPDP